MWERSGARAHAQTCKPAFAGPARIIDEERTAVRQEPSELVDGLVLERRQGLATDQHREGMLKQDGIRWLDSDHSRIGLDAGRLNDLVQHALPGLGPMEAVRTEIKLRDMEATRRPKPRRDARPEEACAETQQLPAGEVRRHSRPPSVSPF